MQFHHEYVTNYFYSLAISISCCFFVIYLLLLCATRKQKTEEREENGHYKKVDVDDAAIVVPEVHVEVENAVGNEFENPLAQSNSNSPKDSSVKEDLRRVKSDSATESFDKYDPESSRKALSLDTVIEKPAKGPIPDIQIQIVEGSGNSDSGNSGTYAKVKNVPKREECAYSVVDIKDSAEKYDVVNGGLIRKTEASVKVKQNELEPDKIIHTSSTASDLYAKVGSVAAIAKNETPQENSGNSSYYASVTEQKIVPEISSQENSGSSGFYESVISTQKPEDLQKSDSRKNSHENSTKNDSLKEKSELDELDSKTNSIGRHKKSSKDKSKHEKKKEEKRHSKDEQVKINSENSPRQGSRFSRVNPLKWSKKHRHQNSDVTVEITTHVEEPKSSSLPRESRPSPRADGVHRSSDEDPPPLPSFDKLVSLAEHRRAVRSSSVPDNINSTETTPSSSPRSPNQVEQAPHLRTFTYSKPSVVITPDKEKQTDENYSEVDSITKQEFLKDSLSIEKDSTAHVTTENLDLQPISKSVSTESVDSDHDYADLTWKENGQISIKPNANESTSINQTISTELKPPTLVVSETNNIEESEYATVDLAKKHHDREVKELYATVDWSKKRVQDDSVETDEDADDMLYEGPYHILPDIPAKIEDETGSNKSLSSCGNTQNYESPNAERPDTNTDKEPESNVNEQLIDKQLENDLPEKQKPIIIEQQYESLNLDRRPVVVKAEQEYESIPSNVSTNVSMTTDKLNLMDNSKANGEINSGNIVSENGIEEKNSKVDNFRLDSRSYTII